MFKKIGQRLNKTFTAQPKEPDDNDFEDCPDKFEPMDAKKLPHLYTVSDVQIEVVVREIGRCGNFVYATGMLAALELLGLPS
jgi:hypothetical protein